MGKVNSRRLKVSRMTKTKVEAVKAARVWCLAALLAFAGLAHADLVGPVVAIQDGDTIDVLVNRQPVRVRLAQIDAPEKRQAFGTRSRQALAELVAVHGGTRSDAVRRAILEAQRSDRRLALRLEAAALVADEKDVAAAKELAAEMGEIGAW